MSSSQPKPAELVFCTLFNRFYLTRGLAMYYSLKKECPEARLYVFAFDDPTFHQLKVMNLPGLIPVSLAEFEDDALLAVKPRRSFAEYCWTCTSSTILWVLEKAKETHCTYIDADLFFYNHPSLLLSEMKVDESVLITSHQYTPKYDQSALSGKYCVQFVYFRNDATGKKVLNWWRDRCLEWCFARHENGKFGDQKYLDHWTQMFDGIHDLDHRGGLAPWNIQQYNAKEENGKPWMRTIKGGTSFAAVFFHFHGVKYYGNGRFLPAPRSYLLTKHVLKVFYKPYYAELMRIQRQLTENWGFGDGTGTQGPLKYFKDRWLKGHWAYVKRNFLHPILKGN
jgi:hypothetical protein